MASTKLTRTQTAGTDRKKFTLSMWVKTSVPSTMSGLWCTEGGWYDGSGMACVLRYDDGSSIMTIYNPSEGGTGGNYNSTTQAFRDCNGWYHFVFAGDTTQSTQADRLKIYVNGEQITYTTNNLPAQDVYWNDLNSNNKTFTIGAGNGSGHYCFEGIMSHVHFSDGYVYNASTFGSTDPTTGEWKINTSPSFTLGNNGFTILKDGNTYTDQSSNSNNFTLSGTLTKTEDCPDNVFATINPLYNVTTFNGSKLSNGNTTATCSTNYKGVILSTLGASTGKYYFEAKITNTDSFAVGITDDAISLNTWSPSSGNYVFYKEDGNIVRPSGSTASGTTYGTNDIIGVAWNATDSEVTFYKNGSAIASAYGVEGTQGTMMFAIADSGTGSANTANCNFGNGYFGTTAVSSAGTNASGNGIFEYDVPTGYTALSTKGLNL
jgi:hypothetical protein